MAEGLWHVCRRNQHWDEKNLAGAWQENRILESYFVPVLDTPSYVSATGQRWPAAPRDEAERAAAGPYTSDAQPYPLMLVPRWLLWLGAAASIGAAAILSRRRPLLR